MYGRYVKKRGAMEWKKVWFRVLGSEAPGLKLGALRKAGQRRTYASA
jgi:hypothetical protein